MHSGREVSAEDAVLTDAFPLGISNERLPGRSAVVRFTGGLLLLVQSEDRPPR